MRKFFTPIVLFTLIGTNAQAQIYANDSLRTLGENNNSLSNLELFIDSNSLTSSQGKKELPDISNFYKISNITASNFDAKHTEEEINSFKEEAQRSFEKYNYFVNLEFGHLIRQNRINKEFQLFNIVTTEDSIKLVGCATCDPIIFRIIEKSDNQLVFSDKAQDEGQLFEFIFSFTK